MFRKILLMMLLAFGSMQVWADPGDENWSVVGDPYGPGNGSIYALAVYGNDLYVGGSFTNMGQNSDISYLAKWDGSNWSAIGSGVDGAVKALAVDSSGNLYVGGSFASAGGVANTRYLAKWDGSTWISLGLVSPQYSVINTMTFDSSNNLIVGGYFTSIAGVANTTNIARWNGSIWSAVGSGFTDSVVLVLAADNNGNIYVGGYSPEIMMWNGTSWSAIGTGQDTLSLEIDNDNSLIVGGYFLEINGIPDTQHIARWNGANWSSIVSGVDNDVHAVHVDDTDTLYMGGYFTEVNGASMPYLAKWNGYVWSPLGSGPYGGPATVITEDASGNILVGSGRFLLKWSVIDTDGDNFQDYEDKFPDDPARAIDFDDDGYDDREDNCLLMYNNQDDFDLDGVGDDCDGDIDGDGLSNIDESGFGTEEYNPDTDWDGLSDGYEVYTSLTDPLLEDTDTDGVNDYDEIYTKLTNPLDSDSDDDTYADGVDDLPLNPTEWIDTDGDGIGNNTDEDDDDDGFQDISDNCPVGYNPDQVNTDMDLQGNQCDSDDDNDGVTDLIDNCQLISNINQRDSDGDAQGDICDAFPYMPLKAALISGGGSHTCTITAGGGMKCWGGNNNGQLGDGTSINRVTPVDVTGLTSNVSAIATGSSHTCAVVEGSLKCWGYNSHGQLGDNTTVNRSLFVNVTGLTNSVSKVSAGDFHTCALMISGGVKCWGHNDYGQLGDNTNTPHYTPVDVTGLSSGVSAVAGGYSHTCALTTSGGVKCWGYNGYGQLGDNTTTNHYEPVDVSGLTSDVDSVVAGNYNTCVLTTGGGVKCWGRNYYGQLGDGTTTQRNTPVATVGLASDVIALTAGSGHVCALTVDGGVKCWGSNSNGQLGDGTTMNRYSPVDVIGLTSGVIAISAGGAHTCALTIVSGIKCWGRNFEGQLADTTNTQRNTSVYVKGFMDDSDNDGVVDPYDNCPIMANQDQADADSDTLPDACIDTDDDNDGVLDINDDFPLDATKSTFVRHDTEADGDSDLLTRSASLGTWTRHTIENAAITGTGSMNAYTSSSVQYVAQLDANGDGDADILTRNTSTGAWYLHQVQSGEVTSTVPIYLYANLDQQFIGAGDFNGDGTDDVMLRSASNGYYTVFLLQKHGVSSTVFYNAWIAASSVPQGVGDFDGDGTDDLLVRRTSDNLYFVFKTTNGGTSNTYCACNIWNNPDWTFQFAGDTNKDGTDDIVVRGTGATGNGQWWNFRMSNFLSTQTTNLNTFLNKTQVSFAASGDYNGDGHTDMLIRVNNGPVYVARIVNGLVSGSTTLLSNLPSDQMVLK